MIKLLKKLKWTLEQFIVFYIIVPISIIISIMLNPYDKYK
jgi:hypothetical protein